MHSGTARGADCGLRSEHIHEHTMEETVALLAPQIKGKSRLRVRLCFRSASTSTSWHRPFQESRKRKKGKFGRAAELLEAAMARAREEEDEFFQTVFQNETTKERHAKVYFRRNPVMLEFFMPKEVLL